MQDDVGPLAVMDKRHNDAQIAAGRAEHDRAALEEEVARLRTQLEEEGARAREFAETCQTLAAAVEDSEKV